VIRPITETIARISIGTTAENEAVLAALRAIAFP
jgi:histidinol-phosphate/aromatic aminotransferase/cobyric acid decarboxylase-like protein